jgi:hypothetical protein
MEATDRRQERRTGRDRRAWNSNLDFPYVDSHGTLVLADRRRSADRRVIHAELLDSDYAELAPAGNLAQ